MPQNLHASMLVIADRGVVVSGPSGSGKTTLCFTLIDLCRASGRFARLVCDDQLLLEPSQGCLVARAPATTAGLAEVRGYQPSATAFERAAVVDLVVELVSEDAAPRFQEMRSAPLAGIPVPLLLLPRRNALQAALAIRAYLESPPFAAGMD